MLKIVARSLVPIALALLVTACTKSGPPPALTDATFSTDLKKGFEKSSVETKMVVQQAAASFEQKQFVAADGAISGLLSRPDLSRDERALASQALINLNQKIATAAAQGDPAAQQIQRMKAAGK